MKTTPEESKMPMFDLDALAQEIRRIDGSHTLGAGALAEALIPFIAALIDEVRGVDAEPVAIGWAWKWPDGILPEGHPRAGWQFERDDPRKEMHPSNIGFIEVVQIYAPKISGLSTQVPVSMAAHIGEREYATHPAPSQPIDKVVVTKNDKGQIVAVTRQNEEGQILSIISESAPSQPTAPVELPVVGDAILKFLDELSDDAAVHIWPDDLERCCRSECVVHAYSVRMGGSDGSHTVPLFSREQVEAAIAAGRKAS